MKIRNSSRFFLIFAPVNDIKMKKIIYTLIPMMLVACGGGKKSPQDGGHGIGIDSATVAQINAEDADYIPRRSDYSFRSDVRTVTEDGEVLWDSIIVCLTDAKGHRQELYSQVLQWQQWRHGHDG